MASPPPSSTPPSNGERSAELKFPLSFCQTKPKGTGAWATEFAEEHPEAQVFGSDLSLIQPLYVPPNCTFVREDCEEEWVYGFLFDYIHLRLM